MRMGVARAVELSWKLASLYFNSSNGAPIHFAVCPDGTCATALAMIVAHGRLVIRCLGPITGERNV